MTATGSSAFREYAGTLPKQDQRLLSQLIEESVELVLFGSRAARVHSRESDLDILCIGCENRRKSGRLDIVWRTAGEIEDPKWLCSELANHIATYGIVLRGSADWRSAVRVSGAAISHKERRVVSLVDGL